MKQFDLDDLVTGKRLTSADQHLLAGQGWRRLGEPRFLHSPLAYAAFELRCAIERCLFEFLWLTQNRNLTKADHNVASNVSKLVKELLKRHGGENALLRKMSFARVFAEATGVPRNDRPAVFDLKALEKQWNQLSEFCHRQLEPMKTWEAMGDAWVRRGYELLSEVETHLWGIVVESKLGWVDHSSLPVEMVTAREAYIAGDIDDNALKTRMDLMTPVFLMRSGKALLLSS